ncbi:DUF3889 domain-containing protein [Lysinibacillus sp. NPDC047702]|uniref:DUF3889 domain-containing protein n=1 Tax=unclassified Lysinibacillus TaxID=2636778 RepID=UPI003D0388D7
MKKFCLSIGIFLIFLTSQLHIPTAVFAQQEDPAYAKWSIVAIKEVRIKYPLAKIVDYLYEGREIQGDTTIEKFKLWLKQNDKEFGVYVKIQYVTKTNKLENIELQEAAS